MRRPTCAAAAVVDATYVDASNAANEEVLDSCVQEMLQLKENKSVLGLFVPEIWCLGDRYGGVVKSVQQLPANKLKQTTNSTSCISDIEIQKRAKVIRKSHIMMPTFITSGIKQKISITDERTDYQGLNVPYRNRKRDREQNPELGLGPKLRTRLRSEQSASSGLKSRVSPGFKSKTITEPKLKPGAGLGLTAKAFLCER
ncbi:hypothetical protein EVAR_95185_1 [Eumeta japonica]|uniref:Uncharacterized protein n=1 Tax=Eumeta variegata TaxID=151549 RepID=A0A4C1VHK4_EUMVA|nr:hypothetical protein EVAR_95185_1 [Eumeta japonica]